MGETIFKKSVILVVIVLISMSVYAIFADADLSDADPSEYSGNCGENATYEFDVVTGTLIISGSGSMYDYSNDVVPWASYIDFIRSVKIGDSVTSIGSFAFLGCTSLASFVVSEKNGYYTSIDGVLFSNDMSALIQYPVAKEGKTYKIPTFVTTIKSSAFKGCTSLTSITISDSITTIEDGAFDIAFYNSNNGRELEQTVKNLAGYTFNNVDGKWIKQLYGKLFGKCGEDATYEFDLTTRSMIISGSGSMSSSSYGVWPWDKYKDMIKSVYIGDSITFIGFFAFRGCTSLSSITIADSVTYIGASAFEGCTSLASVTIPDSVKTIGNSAFRYCGSLKLFTVPDSVTSIGTFAFEGCTSLTSITLPNSITFIGENAFDGKFYGSNGESEVEPIAANLVESTFNNKDGKWIKQEPTPSEDPNKTFGKCGEEVTYELDKSAGILTISGSGAMDSYSRFTVPWYSYKDSIRSIIIGDSVTTLGDYAFCDCVFLDSVTVPDPVTTIGKYVFLGCTSLSSIDLSGSVTAIGDYAFKGCVSLNSISIPSSVKTIGEGAFQKCTSLNSVTLPDSIISLGGSSFAECISLVTIALPASITTLEHTIFGHCRSLTSIIIPDSVTAIEPYAFFGCISLRSIIIPDSVATIGERAFYDCTSLTTVTIPSSIISLGMTVFNGKFYDTDGETVLAANATTLAGFSFNIVKDKWIKQKEFGKCGDTVTYVLDFSTGTLTIGGSGQMGFYSSGMAPWFSHVGIIRSVVISDSVESIGAFAFEGCTILTTVNFGKSVNSIGESAFKGCSSLASFIVSDENCTYSSVGGVLFNADRSTLLQYPVAKADPSYEIPGTVKTIAPSAFKGCITLASITIPNSVTFIDDGVFDVTFYDDHGEDILEPTVANLAGSTFKDIDGKWIKQKEFGKCGDTVTYVLDFFTGALIISGFGQMESYSSGTAPWFAHKDSITSVIIADPITSICDFAFEGCTSITSFIVSEKNESYSSIDGVLFSNDKSILIKYPVAKEDPSYEIPASVTIIRSSAFNGCTCLASITISDSLSTIEAGAFDVTFYDDHGEDILEPTVANLAGSTFKDIDGKWIKQKEFGKCGENITYVLDFSTGTLTITGSGLMCSYSSGNAPWFSHKGSISSIIIGDNVTSISDFAFEGITLIDFITIPDSVKAIGAFAFADCTSLASIKLGSSVTSIEGSAFNGCSSLASYVVSDDNITYISIDGVLFSNDKSALVQYPAAKEGKTYKIPSFVSIIKSFAFKSCTSLKYITIPESVTSIEDSAFDMAFYNPNNVKELEQTVDNLAGYTFKNSGGKWVKQNVLSGKCGEDVTYEFNTATGALTISGSGSMSSSSYGAWPWDKYKDTIKSVHIRNSVTFIGYYAFRGCTSLSSITLADSVTYIGSSAFEGCTSLTSLVIPDSVKTIGNTVFNGCTSLTTITIPSSVNSLGSFVFKDCTSISSIKLSGSFQQLDDSVFSGCISLRSIVIPDSVTSIKGSAFYNCTSLTSVTLSKCLTSIGDYAFSDCTSLTSIALPDSVTTLGEGVFRGCTSLVSVTLSGSIPCIKDSTFRDCSSLSVIEVPISVTSIEGFAFYNCTSLTAITIPAVTSIFSNAFSDCTSLTSISIPDSVTYLGSSVFNGTFYDTDGEVELEQTVENLAGFTFNNTEGKWVKQKPTPSEDTTEVSGECGEGVTYKLDKSTGTLTISGSGAMENYLGLAAPWFSYKDTIRSIIIEDSVTTIGDYAFSYCLSLDSVTVSDSVTTIGKCAFMNCTSLASIEIPCSVTSVSDCAFKNCTTLTSISLPDSVETIGASTFEKCTSLRSVNLPRSISFIGGCAFMECTSLTSISLPDSLTILGYTLFGFCSSLESITIPDSIITIDMWAFYGCLSLSTITIPYSVTTIGDSAFEGCISLTTVTIPDSITSLGKTVFSGKFYDADGEAELEQTVENLAGSTFDNKDGKWIKQKEFGKCGDVATYELIFSKGTLIISGSGKMMSYSNGEAPWYSYKDSIKSIVIGDGVTSIGDFAFEGITSIVSITIPDSVESIGASAFADCVKLSTVNLGRSVNTIDKTAFNGCISLASYIVSDKNGTYSSVDGVLFNKEMTTLIQYPVVKEGTTYLIPDSVKTIKSSAFKGCTSITSITIPDSVTTIETGAFDMVFHDPEGEKELDQTIEHLVGSTFNNVDGKWIKQKEFGKCGEEATYELDFSKGILTISGSGKMMSYSRGEAPWYSHKDTLTSIVIGDGVTTIGDFAFEGITLVDSINIPDSVKSIGASAFADCTSLTSFVVSERNESYSSIDGVLFSNDKSTLIQYPMAKTGASYEIPASVKTIAFSAFHGCKSLTSITILDSVENIEADAFYMVFYDPEGETELEQTVENLVGSTFNKVDGKWIKQASTPSEDPNKVSGECGDTVTYELDLSTGALTINGSGKMASYSSGQAPWYAYKDSIRFIEIADSVTSIGGFAFEGITSIESITIPDSVEMIGASAFADCTKLATVNLGKSVNTIDKAAFNGCTSLALYVVSDENSTYSSVDGVLFSNDKTTLTQYPVAKAGTSYEIPASVKTIAPSAFKGCTSLTSLTILESIETIEADAFDVVFYDPEGETVLEPTVENLVGSTFNKVDGKWIKQKPAPSEDPNKVSGECGDVTYELDKTSGILTISGSGKMTSYSSGEAPWYSYKDTITSIVIGEGITSIGDFAFEGITSIGSISIPDFVESLGASAFADCTKLSTVTLGRSVNSLDKTAFSGCTSLACYVVSENNGTYASIDGVLFSNGKTTLVQYPVAKADASYEIPASVTTIASSAFKGCTSLTSLTIPDTTTTIEAGAFDIVFHDPEGEKELEQTVENLAGFTFDNKDGKWIKQAPTPSEDPSKDPAKCGDNATFEFDTVTGTLTISGSGAMYDYVDGTTLWDSYKESIRYVVIRDSVTSIGAYAFCDCTSLISMIIPDSITSIRTSAFRNCSGLKELIVPASLDTVLSNEHPIFEGCVNIEKFTFTAGAGTWYNYDTGSFQSASLRYTSRILNDNVIQQSSELPNYKYTPWQLSRSTLTSVVISDGVTSIGDSAFKDCTAINSLSLSNTLTTIGDSAFNDCTSLASVVLPDSVDTIGESAFKDCTSLTAIVIPDTVASIGKSAFKDCTSLTSVNLPDSVESIGNMFDGCDSLTTFKVSEESSKYCILDGVLYNNDKTELVWYPAGNSIVSFEIPDGVTSIAAYAFQGSTALTSITLPISLSSIGEGAFNTMFYDTDGETVLEQTTDLAGFTFNKIEDKWVKQSSALLPSPSPSPAGSYEEGPETMYLLAAIIVTIALLAALDFIKKKKF